MVSIAGLWLPIVLSAVLVFLASSVLHMVLKYHRGDFAKLDGESGILAAMRTAEVKPGDYVFPCPDDYGQMNSPEMKKKYEEGPVGFATILPPGPMSMGGSLVQWFVYCLVLSVFVAYLVSRTVDSGSAYFAVFRVAGAVAFIGYAGAHPVASIWGKRRWATTWRHVFDSFIYALLTAGAFAGFYPE